MPTVPALCVGGPYDGKLIPYRGAPERVCYIPQQPKLVSTGSAVPDLTLKKHTVVYTIQKATLPDGRVVRFYCFEDLLDGSDSAYIRLCELSHLIPPQSVFQGDGHDLSS